MQRADGTKYILPEISFYPVGALGAMCLFIIAVGDRAVYVFPSRLWMTGRLYTDLNAAIITFFGSFSRWNWTEFWFGLTASMFLGLLVQEGTAEINRRINQRKNRTTLHDKNRQ